MNIRRRDNPSGESSMEDDTMFFVDDPSVKALHDLRRPVMQHEAPMREARRPRPTVVEAASRLVLFDGELGRLPGAAHHVRALAGRAWISACGRDIMLTAGQETDLPCSKADALVSVRGEGLLILAWE